MASLVMMSIIVADVFGADSGVGLGYDYYFDKNNIISDYDGGEYKYSSDNITS